MKTTETRDIGGLTFAVSQLPARRALEMFGRLGKALGPAAFEAMARGASVDPDSNALDLAVSIAPALGSIFSRLPEGELTAITEALLEPATCNGVAIKPQLDLLFQGKILLLLKVLAFAVEVNYRDFFDAGRELSAKLRTEPAAESTDSPT
jgi:hypothetical protein